MTSELLAKLLPRSVSIDHIPGGHARITSSDVSNALGLMLPQGNASVYAASRYAYAIELSQSGAVPGFRDAVTSDLATIWCERNMQRATAHQLTRYAQVLIVQSWCEAHNRRVYEIDKFRAYGCSSSGWYTSHRFNYQRHVEPLIQSYRVMLDIALNRVKRLD